MSTKLATVIADFRNPARQRHGSRHTSVTIQSATDDDGNALPNGQYFFALDGNNSQKEHIVLHADRNVAQQHLQRLTTRCSDFRRCPFPPHRFERFTHTDFALSSLSTVRGFRYSNFRSHSTTWLRRHCVSHDCQPVCYKNLCRRRSNRRRAERFDDSQRHRPLEATQAQMDAGTTSGSTGARELYPELRLLYVQNSVRIMSLPIQDQRMLTRLLHLRLLPRMQRVEPLLSSSPIQIPGLLHSQ